MPLTIPARPPAPRPCRKVRGVVQAPWRAFLACAVLLHLASSAPPPPNNTVAADALPDHMRMHDQLCGQAAVAKGMGQIDPAIQRLAQAVTLLPNSTVAWTELGIILAHAGDSGMADRCLQTAARTDASVGEPANPDPRRLRHSYIARKWKLGPLEVSIELGEDKAGAGEGGGDEGAQHDRRYKLRLYERFYELDCALRRLKQQVRAEPGNAEALVAAADAAVNLLFHKDAVEMLQRALALRPRDARIFSNLVQAQVKGCVFAHWESNFERLEDVILSSIAEGEPSPLAPIQATMYPLPARVGLAICTQLGNEAHAAARLLLPLLPAALLLAAPPARGRPLRVAYVTSHFTSSSIGREMLFLMGAHDRGKVKPICYALNKDEGSWLQHVWRESISKGCEVFHDVSPLSDSAAALLINKDAPHVLIDLNGWSGGNRATMISMRPAPVQVNYKNWVASSGIPALSFLVGDRVATPPEFAMDFSEAMVLVPNSYFISGHAYQYPLDNPIQAASETTAPLGARAGARSAHGLPPNDFLVANFNNLDKLEPRIWELWTALLGEHGHAALWLQQYPPAKANRVKQMAQEEGKMDVARLTMTPFFKSDHHIAIKALADVFVDNPTYNAHSTAMDTLWGALPLATLPEQKFAARVGASLLAALGSSATVARNLEDLKAMVSRMASCPACLRRHRRRLEANRWREPLYDTVRAVRNFEVSLQLMWEVSRDAGEAGAGVAEGRRAPHLVSTDTGVGGGAGVWGGPLELQAKLHALKVESSSVEKV
ncbi:glycosyl transferase family 41-domain-containing protein [Baffinella frigidus]|nr:glycosyl transferase family 41-domain-containing protein [Cryptophyta sp. CCMP2293]